MHDGRPESFELRLSHPFYQRRNHPFGYCVTTPAFANCVITANSVIGAAAPTEAKEGKTIVVCAQPARTPKLVTVELLHKRLGHVSTKAILAANEAGVWEDVMIRFAPSSFCINCKVGTSCTSNRGKSPVGHATCSGEILFCDVQANPSRTGHTK
jgi:hypothetical protein